jgi:hypothetical protein
MAAIIAAFTIILFALLVDLAGMNRSRPDAYGRYGRRTYNGTLISNPSRQQASTDIGQKVLNILIFLLDICHKISVWPEK